METSLSIGVFGFAMVTLTSLLGVGMKTTRYERDDRASALVAKTLIEEARQGTLPAGTLYLDEQGAASTPAAAVFTVQPTSTAISNSVSRLTLRVVPNGAPDRTQVYAVLLPLVAPD